MSPYHVASKVAYILAQRSADDWAANRLVRRSVGTSEENGNHVCNSCEVDPVPSKVI